MATPVVADGQVFIPSNYGKGGALLRLTNTAAPETVWESLSMQNHFSTAVLDEGFLYGFSGLLFVRHQNGLVALDLKR